MDRKNQVIDPIKFSPDQINIFMIMITESLEKYYRGIDDLRSNFPPRKKIIELFFMNFQLTIIHRACLLVFMLFAFVSVVMYSSNRCNNLLFKCQYSNRSSKNHISISGDAL